MAGVAAYSNTFGMSFNFDDFANIINNPVVKECNIEGLKRAFQSRRAFGIVTFQINYLISGANVFGYHLINLTIHIATALFVYVMISLLIKTPYWERNQIAAKVLPVPFFAALLFVVHPVQSQAVTYIVQRYTSLATLLYIVGIVCYLKARISQQGAERSIYIESGWIAGSLAAGLLAIYTKEIAYTWPIAILLVEILFFDFSRSKMFKIIFALVASVSLLLIKLTLGQLSVDNIISRLDDLTRIQTISSRSDYLFTQFRVIVTYLRLLFLPINQSVDYDYTLSHSFFEWRVFVSFLLLMTIFLFSLWLINASRGKNPYFRLSAFGILWFFITLSVESSFMPIIDLIFEHRVYLPSVGFFIAIGTIGLWFGWQRDSLFAKQGIILGLLIISIILAGATWKRNLVWTNDVTLWEDATVKKPYSARSWNNLGGALIAQREGKKAIHALIKSIELDPSKPDAWNNIGIAIDLLGVYNDRFNRTTEMFNDSRAIENKVVSRWLGDVNNNLGLAYEILGNLHKAEESYRNAVAYYPALGVAYYNLALVAAKKGDLATTEEQKQILWLIDPSRAERLQMRLGGTATTK
jgi:tetratricopeptide (TPR) repeat protein